MAEAELQHEIMKRCQKLGIRLHVNRSSVYSTPGWPDLVVLGKRTLFRELKSQGERPTPDQRKVGILLTLGGCDWGTWQPSDWLDGTIEAELSGVTW
jgi:hypothetical protein